MHKITVIREAIFELPHYAEDHRNHEIDISVLTDPQQLLEVYVHPTEQSQTDRTITLLPHTMMLLDQKP